MNDHHLQDDLQGAEMKSIPGYVKPRIQEIEKRMQSRQVRYDDVYDEDEEMKNMMTPKKSQPASDADDFVSAIASANVSTPMASTFASASQAVSLASENQNMHMNTQQRDDHERFRFLSSILPASNIKQFESEALRRQAEYHARVSDLEGRLALFHARLAMESAERGRDHEYTTGEMVYKHLEGVMRRSLEKIGSELIMPIMDPTRANALENTPQNNDEGGFHDDDDDANSDENAGLPSNDNCTDDETNTANEEKKDSSDNKIQRQSKPPNLVSVERRVNLLEAQMNHYEHVTYFHAKRHHLDSIEHTFRTTLHPALSLETTKADKREGGMVRKFESSAGEYNRRLAECQASRASALGLIQKEIDSWEGIDETRARNVLGEIREMKRLVLMESEERKKQDELVVEKMVCCMDMLQEEMLAMMK